MPSGGTNAQHLPRSQTVKSNTAVFDLVCAAKCARSHSVTLCASGDHCFKTNNLFLLFVCFFLYFGLNISPWTGTGFSSRNLSNHRAISPMSLVSSALSLSFVYQMCISTLFPVWCPIFFTKYEASPHLLDRIASSDNEPVMSFYLLQVLAGNCK